MKDLRVFAMKGMEEFGHRVSRKLNSTLTPLDERIWSDGEPYIKSVTGPEGNVRNCDCYILCSLYGDAEQSVNDRFLKMLFFASSLKEASARQVTLVCPYLAYQRQDRKTESRAGIYTKYTAWLIAASRADRLITMDAHNLSALQSSSLILTDHLEAKKWLADFVCGIDGDGLPSDRSIPDALGQNEDVLSGKRQVCVLAPDSGGVGRAKRFRNAIERRLGLKNKIDVVHIDKGRGSQGELTDEGRGNKIAGDVEGKLVVVVDDLIASGGTIELSLDTTEKYGGEVYAVCATHGQFTGKANERLLNRVKRLVVTDTLPPHLRLNKDKWEGKLHVCRVADVFAEAIRTTHFGGSISELLED